MPTEPVRIDLGPAFRLFCLALRRSQSLDELDEMRRLAADLGQWDVIVRGARRHRVAARVLAGLRACESPHVPAGVFDRLHRQSVASVRKSLAQTAEIGRLAGLFGGAGIPLLVLKGEVLSVQLYGETGRRTARDIDLLIEQNDLAAAQGVLVDAGYNPQQNFRSPRQRAAHLRFIKEFEFVHALTGGMVELHHRLTDNPNLLALDFSSLWNEREELRVGEGVVATLPRHRLPLYLCVHGCDHAWSRLQWLVDFAAALSPAPDMAAIVKAADAGGLRWPFLQALLLAHEWLGLPIDDALLAVCRDCPQIRRRNRLLRRLYAATDWYELPPKGSWKRAVRYSLWERLYRFSLKPDRRYWTSQVQRDWFSPADRDAVPLPESLSWLYPFLRPWGWLLRR